jgi:hypothetical protein
MKRYYFAGFLTACSLAWAVFGTLRSAPEPMYAGRPVSEWLDGGYEQISMAMHETGPAAAPCVFSKLRWEHPTYGHWTKYRKVRAKIPGVLQKCLPRPKSVSFDELTACNALLDIGPAVIPSLIAALKDPNPAVQLASAYALNAFRQQGRDIELTTP